MAGILGQAVVLFAVTNVDDIVLLSLYFGQARGDRTAERHIIAGQYLGFGAILAVSVLAALGLRLLPDGAIAYLGLIPIALGVRAAFSAWQHPDSNGTDAPVALQPTTGRVAGVTFSNGGDNISVYVPVLTAAGAGGMGVYVAAFVVMVAVWCFAGRYFATRPLVARVLARWGHIVLPVVLITIGTVILIEGGAFGL